MAKKAAHESAERACCRKRVGGRWWGSYGAYAGAGAGAGVSCESRATVFPTRESGTALEVQPRMAGSKTLSNCSMVSASQQTDCAIADALTFNVTPMHEYESQGAGGAVNIDDRGMWDNTPLICACQYGHGSISAAQIRLRL